jgi:translation initiation factor 3 subunit L
MSKSIEFHLPDAVRDFVFDLHEATRLSQRVEDVQRLYESTYKELTDKYFSHSSWPTAAAVASECRDDEVFLIFYREMRLRHLFAKLKPQLNDYMESWNNYKNVREFRLLLILFCFISDMYISPYIVVLLLLLFL